mmetsp:Transcript_53745/g.109557  ORF Transcript_53745/g.109557 Transcript_53745/m.109557 type:complete len:308 (+) Transcript_53745:265-1188(+)
MKHGSQHARIKGSLLIPAATTSPSLLPSKCRLLRLQSRSPKPLPRPWRMRACLPRLQLPTHPPPRLAVEANALHRALRAHLLLSPRRRLSLAAVQVNALHLALRALLLRSPRLWPQPSSPMRPALERQSRWWRRQWTTYALTTTPRWCSWTLTTETSHGARCSTKQMWDRTTTSTTCCSWCSPSPAPPTAPGSGGVVWVLWLAPNTPTWVRRWRRQRKSFARSSPTRPVQATTGPRSFPMAGRPSHPVRASTHLLRWITAERAPAMVLALALAEQTTATRMRAVRRWQTRRCQRRCRHWCNSSATCG